MHRGHKLYLEDILASIDKIQHYIGLLSAGDFIRDEMRVDAVIRNLELSYKNTTARKPLLYLRDFFYIIT